MYFKDDYRDIEKFVSYLVAKKANLSFYKHGIICVELNGKLYFAQELNVIYHCTKEFKPTYLEEMSNHMEETSNSLFEWVKTWK